MSNKELRSIKVLRNLVMVEEMKKEVVKKV
jgi:hypothetical protein